MTNYSYRACRCVPYICVIALLLFLHGGIDAGDLPEDRSGNEKGNEKLSYKTEFTGIENKKLASLFRSASQLIALQDRPPPGMASLERRVLTDLDVFRKVLRSEGYYAGELSYRITPGHPAILVSIDVKTGPKYRFKEYTIQYTGPGADDPNLPVELNDPELNRGNRAKAQLVVNARKKLLDTLADIGHPLARVVEQNVVVDHGDESMSVTIQVEPGETARFGSLTVEGTTKIDTGYIESFVSWKEGEVFDQRQIKQLRERLLDTGLFAMVAIERPSEPEAGGILPVTIRLQERKHRTISLAGQYSTDEGFSAEALWEHRNLLGLQDRLTLATEVGEIKQEFDMRYLKKNFRRQNQNLLLDGTLTHEDFPAYTGPLTRYFGGLERPIAKKWKILAGIPLEFSNLDDLQGTRDFYLFGLEVAGERDTSNNRFDPSEGTRLRLSFRPYYGRGEDNVSFLVSDITGTGYYAPVGGTRFILASRMKFGTIVGEDTSSELPANKRFYSGGGGSIRGYKFQFVGPMGTGETPLGGRSLLELGVELRAKATETIGGVIFVEGGQVYDDELPDFDGDLQWAAGFGVRYFTMIGPVRLDFGFPLNPRDIDDSFQFYISIGQAF